MFCFVECEAELDIFDITVNKADTLYREAMCSMAELSDKYYIKESENDSILTTIKKFFATLISGFKNLINNIKTAIREQFNASSTDASLHKAYKELKMKKAEGVTKVKVMNVWKLEKEYSSAVFELQGIARRFSKMKYTRTADIDKDIEKFNAICNKYEAKFDNIEAEPVVVPIDKMIEFIEKEVSNRSNIMESLAESEEFLKELEYEAERIQKEEQMLGPDIIPKKLSMIKRMSMGITNFIRKVIRKIVKKTAKLAIFYQIA